jgi:hypothetical protein
MILAVAMIVAAKGQSAHSTAYDWLPDPKFVTATSDTSVGEVVVRRHISIEYFFQEGLFLEYYVYHKIIYVNNDNAIARNNRQYVPIDEAKENIIEKARVILPNGKVVTMQQNDVRTTIDSEDGLSYRYFPVEGVQTGALIEVLIKQIRYPSYNGRIVYAQDAYPVKEHEFMLISPLSLEFAFKSYNGCPPMKKDTAVHELNLYRLVALDMPELEQSGIFPFNPNRAGVLFKLDKNHNGNNNDMVSYPSIAQAMYRKVTPQLDKKTLRSLDDLLSKARLSQCRDLEDKVYTLEQFAEENFRLAKGDGDDLSHVPSIVATGNCSEWGSSIILSVLLRRAGIEHELVLTTERSKYRFDKDFATHYGIQEFLIYVPGIKQYLTPGDPTLRNGLLPPQLAGADALYVSELVVGDITTAVGQIKRLPETRSEWAQHDTYVSADLTGDLLRPSFHVRNELFGYMARGSQAYFQYMSDEVKEKNRRETLEFFSKDGEFTNITSANDRLVDFNKRHFVVEGDIITEEFTQQMGDKTLFRVGMLIGTQTEMYREHIDSVSRPIDIGYARSFKRRLTVKIPPGQTLIGVEKLNMDVTRNDGKGNLMTFKSEAVIMGDSLTVDIIENYPRQTFSGNQFKDYRDVINAAADFSRLAVVIGPR